MFPRLMAIIAIEHHNDGPGSYALTMKTVLLRVSIAMMKQCDQTQFGEERLYLAYTLFHIITHR